MKFVVLGGGGFIGSHMLKFLKDKGHFVRAVDKSFKKERSPLYQYSDEVVCLDLRDFKSCAIAIGNMDMVIHLASDMGGVGYFHNHDYSPYLNNMEMDSNVLRACQGSPRHKRLFYASSACIYPVHLQMEARNAPKLSEALLATPADCDQMYGWEKLMMTKLCERAPLDARVGILHSIFGEYQETEGERRKFPTSIAVKAVQAKQFGKPIEIWGDGTQIRTFCYIDDALEKIYQVLMRKEYYGAVNIGSEEEVTITQAAEMCCDILGIHPLDLVYQKNKPTGVLSRSCSNKKFETYYQYKNKVSTRQGFERLLTWLQNR